MAELTAFALVVEARGFSAAARDAGLRKATLSQRVRSLEERLGVSLLARTTRSVRLTDEGRAYFEHAQRALTAARQAESAVLASRSTASGRLRISMSPPLAAMLLDTVIAPYMLRYRDVALALDTSTRTVDVTRESFDIAIRVGKLADSSLRARRLGVVAGGYFASPGYLSDRGVPKRVDDLLHHDTIVIPRGDRPPEWHFVEGGRPRSIVVRPRLTLNTFELGLNAARAGLGIVPSPDFCVKPYVARGELTPVLRSSSPPGFEIHAVFPADGALVPKTRLFIDMLAAWFASRPNRARVAKAPQAARRRR